MRKSNILSVIATLIVLLGIGSYVIVITYDIPMPFLNWNPPPPNNEIPLALTYPEALVPSSPNGTVFMANMLLKFNGELAENTLVQIESASCEIGPEQSVSVIAIGFEDAFLPNTTNSIQQGAVWGNGAICATFVNSEQTPINSWVVLHSYMTNNITFPVAGDYSPSMFLTLPNQPTPIQYTFNQIRIHVLSTSEINMERTNKLNLGLTFAIVAFSFIEGFRLILGEIRERPTTVSSPPSSTMTKSKGTEPERKAPNQNARAIQTHQRDYFSPPKSKSTKFGEPSSSRSGTA